MGRKRRRTKFYCLNCDKEDEFKTSQLKTHPDSGRFCSRNCRIEFYKRFPERHPNYRGGFFEIRGYKRVGNTYEHRRIMKRKIGRKLLSSEVVHHRNGNKSDNRIENLTILSRGDHSRVHGSLKKLRIFKCSVCGKKFTTFVYGKKRCSSQCSREHKRNQYKLKATAENNIRD